MLRVICERLARGHAEYIERECVRHKVVRAQSESLSTTIAALEETVQVNTAGVGEVRTSVESGKAQVEQTEKETREKEHE